MKPSRLLQLVSLLCLSALAAGAHEHDHAPALGSAYVVAPMPPFPEGVAVRGHKAYVSTRATFDDAGAGPSQVTVVDLRSGATSAVDLQGEFLPAPHGASGEAFDADGNLYVIVTQLGIVRLSPSLKKQTIYSPALPTLPACDAAPAPCRPTFAGPPALANDLAFDEDGWLYVTDSFQATLWRIPPGGGPAQIWFQDARLGGAFGPNGLRFDKSGHKVYFTVTSDDTGAGIVYTLPAIDQPQAADLHAFHTFAWEGPDDLVFGLSGKLYVSLAFGNAIAVLDETGAEVARYGGVTASGVPVDGPANMAFDDESRSLLFANHAPISQDPAHFGLVSMFVDDRALPLERPEIE
jgi:sugar lactone lactonase YvrE